jgi:hypothetical protein
VPHSLKTTLLAFLTFALTSAPARAACPTWTLEHYYADIPVIFVGRATSQTLPGPIVDMAAAVTVTTFEVEEVWKGTLTGRTLRITTCGGRIEGRDETVTCGKGMTFEVGVRYLVFAAGEPLATSVCVPTARIQHAGPTLEWLSDKPHSTVR